jgi:hypothetical protein
MWNILDKYTKYIWLDILLDNKDFLLFTIDHLLYYHKKHLILRKKIDKEIEKIIIQKTINKQDISQRVSEQLDINNQIRTYFVSLVIELSKIFESDNIFKEEIDNLWCFGYERLKRWKSERIKTLSDTIIHFRDACVHNKNQDISTQPEFKKHNIEWWIIHLDFACDSNNSNWVFMIWNWQLGFNKIEEIIKTTLVYFFLKK